MDIPEQDKEKTKIQMGTTKLPEFVEHDYPTKQRHTHTHTHTHTQWNTEPRH